jgi:hypothetical protein
VAEAKHPATRHQRLRPVSFCVLILGRAQAYQTLTAIQTTCFLLVISTAAHRGLRLILTSEKFARSLSFERKILFTRGPMKIRLEGLLSWLTIITAVAYALGWLKTSYYFDAFGIGVPSLGLSLPDYLFESWFVLENVVFVVLLAWYAAKTQYRWAWVLLGITALTPLISHYAFLVPEYRIAKFLILYRHDILKFVPLGVYATTLVDVRARHKLKDITWPHGKPALVYAAIILVAWSISTAKHFGSFDAARAQMWPDEYLSRAVLHTKSPANESGGPHEFYSLFATSQTVFLWDHRGFRFGAPDQRIDVIAVPREEVQWQESSKTFQIQPGSLFF